MGVIVNTYIATNVKTGEVITGTYAELTERLGMNTKALYQYVERGIKAKGEWFIKVAGTSTGKKSIWQEWDDFTEPIRQYMKRRKAK